MWKAVAGAVVFEAQYTLKRVFLRIVARTYFRAASSRLVVGLTAERITGTEASTTGELSHQSTGYRCVTQMQLSFRAPEWESDRYAFSAYSCIISGLKQAYECREATGNTACFIPLSTG